jgi:hypothetical protein
MPSSSGAKRGYSATVKIKVGSPEVTTSITGIENFDFPDQTPDNIDVTHLTSPEDTEEFIPDMKKAPTWPLTHHYVPGSPMDVALSAVEGGEIFILALQVPGADEVEYAAYLNSYRPTGIAAKGSVMMAISTFTVMGKVAA